MAVVMGHWPIILAASAADADAIVEASERALSEQGLVTSLNIGMRWNGALLRMREDSGAAGARGRAHRGAEGRQPQPCTSAGGPAAGSSSRGWPSARRAARCARWAPTSSSRSTSFWATAASAASGPTCSIRTAPPAPERRSPSTASWRWCPRALRPPSASSCPSRRASAPGGTSTSCASTGARARCGSSTSQAWRAPPASCWWTTRTTDGESLLTGWSPRRGAEGRRLRARRPARRRAPSRRGRPGARSAWWTRC
ncbi:unnamed protein product, partial [Prorocentrum cordatum]